MKAVGLYVYEIRQRALFNMPRIFYSGISLHTKRLIPHSEVFYTPVLLIANNWLFRRSINRGL
jgi:hypothetical protein